MDSRRSRLELRLESVRLVDPPPQRRSPRRARIYGPIPAFAAAREDAEPRMLAERAQPRAMNDPHAVAHVVPRDEGVFLVDQEDGAPRISQDAGDLLVPR